MEIRVVPRQGILDPEGETIGRALAELGYGGVAEVRAGRLIRLTLQADDEAAAASEAARMCGELLANPVIEDFEVAVRPAGRAATSGGGA